MRARVLSIAVRHPVEAAYRFFGQVEQRRVGSDQQAAAGAYGPDPYWEDRLMDRLGPRGRVGLDDFAASWKKLESGAGGLVVESHDGDAALARAVWIVSRGTGVQRAVETGVARGVSSRMILEAFQKHEEARLWSVDLPLLSEEWADLLGSAVPQELRRRWEYVRGPSRRVLPKLLRRIGPIDLFVQDSRSTLPTASFEFGAAWGALRPGGFLIANSVDRSLAFANLVDRVHPHFALTARFDRKPGLFGIAEKS